MDPLMRDIRNLVLALDENSKHEKVYVMPQYLKEPCIRAGGVTADGRRVISQPPFVEGAPVIWEGNH